MVGRKPGGIQERPVTSCFLSPPGSGLGSQGGGPPASRPERNLWESGQSHLNSRVSKKAVSSLGSVSSQWFAHYIGVIRGPFWIPLLTPSNVDLKQSNSQLFYQQKWFIWAIPGLGRSPGEGNGNPLQYSCLENPMDRGAWQATVHGVAKVYGCESWTVKKVEC